LCSLFGIMQQIFFVDLNPLCFSCIVGALWLGFHLFSRVMPPDCILSRLW